MLNNSTSNTVKKTTPFFKTKWFITIVVILVLFVGYKIFHHAKSPYQFISVTSGPVTETVSVTGNTTPTKSVSLGFQNSGTIASSNYDVGDSVVAGTVIASLNTSDLEASLQQAQANVDAQNAKLDGLNAGAQPQDIAVSQSALDKSQQDLANMYGDIIDTSTTAYSSASDAVRTQLGAFFTNPETSYPQLSYQTQDASGAYVPSTTVNALRASASVALNTWNTELSNTTTTSSTTALLKLTQDEISYLKTVQNLLNAVSMTLSGGTTSLSATTLSTYKANVSVAITEVNNSMTNLNSITQNIASQNLTVAQLQAELSLKEAGSTSQDIDAQQAEVEQAQAAVASAQAKLSDSEIVAPISGVITQQDAKVGQIATPGTPLVSIIGNGGFEVDAGVSETDIGKLAIGNKVSMTLDAFPNETFTGSVFYIAPAETNIAGVISYQIKISFDKNDSRLKSGLTANIDVQTKHKDTALVLPQYAILQNDSGTFVETLVGNVVTKVPVTLGIQDQNGNVEMLSGVTVGEQVINIGLKTQ